tara:strand:- start:126 stop:413 length:288 start_codon:yes stop_codon:yes gene_type:complete
VATNKNSKAMCDQCSFVYTHRVMKLNSYDMLVCPSCFDGAFDLKNHPQNKAPDVRDNTAIKNPRPDNDGRNLTWALANITWNDDSDPNLRKWDTV